MTEFTLILPNWVPAVVLAIWSVSLVLQIVQMIVEHKRQKIVRQGGEDD